MRLFVALEIGEEAREEVSRAVEELRRRHGGGVRWDPPEKYHVTVKFLGETDPARLSSVTDLLDRASMGTTTFSAALMGFGAFPPRGDPRVLWAGVSLGAEACKTLAARVEEGAAATGFPRESRPFHPHVTVGRVRPGAPGDRRALRAAIEARREERLGPAFEVRRLVLFESRLDPGGSIYHEVHASPFEG